MDKVDKQVLLKKGAEAVLYLTEWHGRKVIIKARHRKQYRPVELDMKIRSYRTIHEPQLMHEAHSLINQISGDRIRHELDNIMDEKRVLSSRPGDPGRLRFLALPSLGSGRSAGARCRRSGA